MNTLIARTRSLVLLAVLIGIAGCERPPVESTQKGFRGTGMVQIDNPRLSMVKLAAIQIPEPVPAASPEGPKAADVFQNVQVLGDLSVGQFTRVMTAMTQWVSPEQGCNYCHNPQNLASDDVYTKVVARRMLEMTRHINSERSAHVGETGITCYTCHGGQPVPANVWAKDTGLAHASGMSADRQGQNIASVTAGYTSLPYDPFSSLLTAPDGAIRVASATALPNGSLKTIKQTEHTYSLMMHLSQGLGVNCTFCHNSRSFMNWQESSSKRVTAWHGLQMVRDLNAEYMEPLQSVFPANRLGQHGDVLKVNCATCHQGINKPLNGASMFKDYPELGAQK